MDEELKKQLEGQYGARRYFERQGWGESVVNMTPGVEALEWAVAEIERLRGIEERMNRLADAYEANVTMLEGIAESPDGLLAIMAECSRSAAKMIRKAIEGE